MNQDATVKQNDQNSKQKIDQPESQEISKPKVNEE